MAASYDISLTSDTEANELLTSLKSETEYGLTKDNPVQLNITNISIAYLGSSSANDLSLPSIIYLSKHYVSLIFTAIIITDNNATLPTSGDSVFEAHLTTDTANSLSLDSSIIDDNPYIVSINDSVNYFSNIISANNMFRGCSGLTSIDIDTSNFENVIDATNMFLYCKSLTEIDCSYFINVTNASGMFGSCESLTNIDTTGFDSLTNSTTWMFQDCKNLKTLNAQGLKNVTLWYQTVNGCTSLKEIANFICPIDTTQANDFRTGTNTVYKVPYTNTINTSSTMQLLRLRATNTDNNYTINVTKRGITDSNNTTNSFTFESSYPMLQTSGNLDEEAIDSSISDENFKSMVLYKVPWSLPEETNN